MAAEVKIHLS